MSGDDNEDEQTERVRNQGKEDGLFRACMDEIRSSHTTGQALRTATLAAGLLSDKYCYAELLGQFYVATAALEKRIDELLTKDSCGDDEKSLLLVAKVKKLGYSFTSAYEADLQALLGREWKGIITSWTTEPAKQYVQRLESANDVECVAAAFILHGPLVIGGGAMLKPKVERAFGENATNVFEDVIGTARGGRSSRRREFIDLYDSLLENDVDANYRFEETVAKCGQFMKLNNQMMVSVRKKPWWMKYVAASSVAIASAIAWRIIATTTESSTIRNASLNVAN
mmetsp:Transcript_3952/g.6081  ORF Transcript_3952/g.6081 Transcript_3952/m.6081 type:complete len:284 (+) Transcript_3952:220-1071(+)